MDIAIIDSNMLTCMGLQGLIEDIIPTANIRIFRSYEELIYNQPKSLVHYFVSSSIYFENAQFFISQPHRSIVLVHGDAYPRIAGLLTLNVCQDEKALVKDILGLREMGHPQGGAHNHSDNLGNEPIHSAKTGHCAMPARNSILSAREIEVAILLAKGYINKEVADRLSISLTTAITHRKNIMEKLKARSLADIIIYVVMNGLASIDEL